MVRANDRLDWRRESALPPSALRLPPSAFTLVEMLVAMAITLVMMGAVVTLFANVSNSVRDRRATIEMSGQLRHARNMLQQDLQGATCPGLTWRRPEENQGYIEIIEGPYREGNATNLIDGQTPPTVLNPEIDHTTSIIPSSKADFSKDLGHEKWTTDGAGLGDADDILMFTVRNEHEPFVGNMPATVRPTNNNFANTMPNWTTQTIESPLAEVVWYAVENPGFIDNTFTDQYSGFFGEPGMRTIYRRTLLIAPWINPYRNLDPNSTNPDAFQIGGSGPTFTAHPGLVRIFPASINAAQAIAGLIAFQERYDLSVRLEFDPLLDPPNGRWTIVANTLGDLTKRENRYEHHCYAPSPPAGFQPGRYFPFAAASSGSGYSGGSVPVVLVTDPEIPLPTSFTAANAMAAQLTNIAMAGIPPVNGVVGSYTVGTPGNGYPCRPFAYVNGPSSTLATARAQLNDSGSVIRMLPGFVPLSGARRGEDVMLSDALAFDLRVFDPGAPLFGIRDAPVTATSDVRVVLGPSDPGWLSAYASADNMKNDGTGAIGNNNSGTPIYPYVGTGAYVDLGYGYNTGKLGISLYAPRYAAAFASGATPWFFAPAFATQFAAANLKPVANPGALTDVYGIQLAPGYADYDTWSFHYENDGIDEDHDNAVDQATNGLDDPGHYYDPTFDKSQVISSTRNGPDDVGERETAPPYDKPLRGVQVLLRVYERDSRQIRQVSVDQHFVPE